MGNWTLVLPKKVLPKRSLTPGNVQVCDGYHIVGGLVTIRSCSHSVLLIRIVLEAAIREIGAQKIETDEKTGD
jgi:hypothetical protein